MKTPLTLHHQYKMIKTNDYLFQGEKGGKVADVPGMAKRNSTRYVLFYFLRKKDSHSQDESFFYQSTIFALTPYYD